MDDKEVMISTDMTREDHTFCEFCKAPFHNPHGTYKKKQCPRNVLKPVKS